MDLKLFFDSISPDIVKNIDHESCFLQAISANIDNMPKWKKAHIALLGVGEYRGGLAATHHNAADLIRLQLYKLHRQSHIYNVVDIGNLRIGENLEQTYLRLSEVVAMLLKNNVLPIIIGGSHDLTLAQYMAYQDTEKLIEVLNVDALLDMDSQSTQAAHSHIHTLFLHEPNYLFGYTHLAYQSYLNDYQQVNLLKNFNYEALSIGEMRNDFTEVEPYIRQADMLSFDTAALRQAQGQVAFSAFPFGLSGEEACQIAWYAGCNDKLTSLGIYGYYPQNDSYQQTAFTIATMIWYFIEGFYSRKNELPIANSYHTKYAVPFEKTGEIITFYKSNLSEKWWLEVPLTAVQQPYESHKIVPCSYKDYQEALQGHLPDRWIKASKKGI
jgi:formiminoglutamase